MDEEEVWEVVSKKKDEETDGEGQEEATAREPMTCKTMGQ